VCAQQPCAFYQWGFLPSTNLVSELREGNYRLSYAGSAMIDYSGVDLKRKTRHGCSSTDQWLKSAPVSTSAAAKPPTYQILVQEGATTP
jgi:hypothetical protein